MIHEPDPPKPPKNPHELPWEVRDAHETRIQQLAARYAAVPDAVLDAEPQESV